MGVINEEKMGEVGVVGKGGGRWRQERKIRVRWGGGGEEVGVGGYVWGGGGEGRVGKRKWGREGG